MTDLMTDVRLRLTEGAGFVLLDRLPVEGWSDAASRAITWLLNMTIAPPIMQKWKGHRVYDVRDTGAKLDYGVRRSVTIRTWLGPWRRGLRRPRSRQQMVLPEKSE